MKARLLLAAWALASVSACGSGISLDEPIEGPTWRLVQIDDRAVASEPASERDAQLRFDAKEARVSGSGGCNRFAGSFTRNGTALRIGPLGATKMACGEPLRNATESQFFTALQATTGYRLQAPGRLTLLDARTQTLAVLVRNP